MMAFERRQEIVRIVVREDTISVRELAESLDVSEATIRRDLRALEKDSAVQRVRGGVSATRTSPRPGALGANGSLWTPSMFEVPLSERLQVRSREKSAIAKVAADLCQEGDSIIIDGSSTTFHMAEHLRPDSLKILTNSFALSERLITLTRNTVVLTGGVIYRESLLLFDPFGGRVYEGVNVSKVFMGVKGIDTRGFSNSDMLLIRMDQAMLKRGKEVIILADSSKFDQYGDWVLCGFEDVSRVITDSGISSEHRNLVRNAGVDLIVVDPETQEILD